MDLGPETHFIINSDSLNSSSSRKCHIVTLDASYSNSKDIKNVFFTDNYIK